MNYDLYFKIDDLKKMDKGIKNLKKRIKKVIKEKEKKGYDISPNIKETLYSLIESISDKYSYDLIKDNEMRLLKNIPDNSGVHNKINDLIYKELLTLLIDYIEFGKNDLRINKTLTCIRNIDKISEWGVRTVSSNPMRLLNIVDRTGSDTKTFIGLDMLNKIYKLHNKILEGKIIELLDKIDNEEKLKTIESLMSYFDHSHISTMGGHIEKILEYIEIEKNSNYDKNLNEIIKKLYAPISSKSSKLVPINILDDILELNCNNCSNRNIGVIIKLLSSDIFKMDAFNRNLLFVKVLNMDFKEEEFENKFISIITKIVLPIKDYDLQEKIIERVCSVKNVKSLEVFTDLYPILNKYSNEDDLIDVVDELSKENIEIPGSVKKLTIPIKYKIKED